MFFPIQGAPNFASAAILMPMDGADNSTVFNDFSPSQKTVTRSGSAIISAALGFPTAYIPSGAYLNVTTHVDFAIGTGGYTLSFRCSLSNTSGLYTVFDCRPGSTNGFYPTVLVYSTGVLSFYFNGADRIVSSSGAIVANTTYFITLCRSGSSTKMFLNGVQVGSTYSNSNSIPQSRILIGGSGYSNSPAFVGYIWDIQYHQAALYTADFTPPPNKSLLSYGSNKAFYQQPRTQPSFLQAAQLGL